MSKFFSCLKKAEKEIEDLEPEVSVALKDVMNVLSPALISSAKAHVAKQKQEQIANVLTGLQPSLSGIVLSSVQNNSKNIDLKSKISQLA